MQVAQRALQENQPEMALEWCDENAQWLEKYVAHNIQFLSRPRLKVEWPL